MSAIEKFMTNLCGIVSEPRLTSFSKFKYHKQDRSNGYFCKQMINSKTRKPFLKFITKFTKKVMVTFLESYLKGSVALNFVVLKANFKGLESLKSAMPLKFALFFMILRG
ncbi:hypothetical protein [Campylobacter concisus]|uniref:hypothetical protein n=1 Tax=Campylobacter concisus TaxID=199 RepID=UPI000CD91D55|nr:hypothetical protein [Campylobacter concisus]